MQIHLQRQFEDIPYDVVWNGTIAAEEAKANVIIIPVKEKPLVQPVRGSEIVKLAMRELAKAGHYQVTQAEIAEVTGLKIGQINSGLYALVKTKQVGKRLSAKDGRRQLGQQYFLLGEK